MQLSFRRSSRLAVVALLVATLVLCAAPQAFGDDWARDRAAAGALEGLDPAIRTALAARAPADSTAPPLVASIPSVGTDEFAWGAAALGLGVGIAAMCVLLGCVTLVRSHGRLRSV